MSPDPDVQAAARRGLAEHDAADAGRLSRRGTSFWPIQIIVAIDLLFGLYQFVALPVRANSSVVASRYPDSDISEATRAALTDDEIAIMEWMPQDIRWRTDIMHPDRQSDFVADWCRAQA